MKKTTTGTRQQPTPRSILAPPQDDAPHIPDDTYAVTVEQVSAHEGHAPYPREPCLDWALRIAAGRQRGRRVVLHTSVHLNEMYRLKQVLTNLAVYEDGLCMETPPDSNLLVHPPLAGRQGRAVVRGGTVRDLLAPDPPTLPNKKGTHPMADRKPIEITTPLRDALWSQALERLHACPLVRFGHYRINPEHIDYVLHRRDGMEVYFSGRAAPLVLEDPDVCRWLGEALDLMGLR